MEYTLRYVVGYRARRATKTALFTKILQATDVMAGVIRRDGWGH